MKKINVKFESKQDYIEALQVGCNRAWVEMAALGYGLALAKHKMWDPLNEEQKENYYDFPADTTTLSVYVEGVPTGV